MRDCVVPPRRSDDAVSPRHHRQLQALRRSDCGVSPRHLEASLFIGSGPTLRQSDLFSKEHSVVAHSHDRRRRHTTSSLPSTTHFRVSHHATFTTTLAPSTPPQRALSTPLLQSPLPHSGGGAGPGADEARAAAAARTSALSISPSGKSARERAPLPTPARKYDWSYAVSAPASSETREPDADPARHEHAW